MTFLYSLGVFPVKVLNCLLKFEIFLKPLLIKT